MAKRKRFGAKGFGQARSAVADKRRGRSQRRSAIITSLVIFLIGMPLFALLVVWSNRPPEPAAEVPSAVDTAGWTAMESSRPLAELNPEARHQFYSAPPEMVIDPDRTYRAVVTTERGEMTFDLFAAKAPLAVNNFVFLANQGFYDGTIFHRVIEDFMAQAGDPLGTGTGGPGYAFADEFDPSLRFDRRGLLAMANSGPATNGSQFFVTFGPAEWLNDAHTIFGELVAGDETLSALRLRDPAAAQPGDLIEKIEILEK